MKSYCAYTDEIDDLEKGVKELSEGIERSKLRKNSLGLVFTDYDIDMEELTKRLSEEFDFPVIGGTTLASINKEAGLRQLGIQITVFTADDVRFSAGIITDIDGNGDADKVRRLYRELSEGEKEKPKIIFTLAATVGQAWNGFTSDEIVEILDEESGGCPVLGGAASGDFSYLKMRAFCGSRVSASGVAVALIYGNLKPLFVAENSTRKMVNLSWKITKGEGRQVSELDGCSVKEKFREAGLVPEGDTEVTEFLTSPFLCNLSTKDGDTIEVLRGILYLDHKKDLALYLGTIEEGAYLTPGIMDMESIEESVRDALTNLSEKIKEEKNYHYESVFIISCLARYCLFVADKQIEARQIPGKFEDDVTVSGFYSMGEFCPQIGLKNGKYHNVFNNETFVAIAL
ncbi:MAG: FIST C-terminal domain-containing protein [Lachnospiraceae bacterium]|nr:FIST C-terminal domain-containing protein [Lachnospiraceae bacterium]